MDILLIEDNEGDAIITNETLKGSRFAIDLFICYNGSSGINYLLEQNGLSKRPKLILLDRNLPDMDGQEIIDLLKSSPQWSAIPVFLFVTSKFESEIWAVNTYRPDYFFTKPLNIALFDEIVAKKLP